MIVIIVWRGVRDQRASEHVSREWTILISRSARNPYKDRIFVTSSIKLPSSNYMNSYTRMWTNSNDLNYISD